MPQPKDKYGHFVTISKVRTLELLQTLIGITACISVLSGCIAYGVSYGPKDLYRDHARKVQQEEEHRAAVETLRKKREEESQNCVVSENREYIFCECPPPAPKGEYSCPRK